MQKNCVIGLKNKRRCYFILKTTSLAHTSRIFMCRCRSGASMLLGISVCRPTLKEAWFVKSYLSAVDRHIWRRGVRRFCTACFDHCRQAGCHIERRSKGCLWRALFQHSTVWVHVLGWSIPQRNMAGVIVPCRGAGCCACRPLLPCHPICTISFNRLIVGMNLSPESSLWPHCSTAPVFFHAFHVYCGTS